MLVFSGLEGVRSTIAELNAELLPLFWMPEDDESPLFKTSTLWEEDKFDTIPDLPAQKISYQHE